METAARQGADTDKQDKVPETFEVDEETDKAADEALNMSEDDFDLANGDDDFTLGADSPIGDVEDLEDFTVGDLNVGFDDDDL